MATVTPIDELRRTPTACLFEGREQAPVSIFVTAHERGQGAQLHFHPYPEVLVVQAGQATFTIGDEQLEVDGGHIVVVDAEVVHGFTCSSDDTLRIVSVHPSPELVQTDISAGG